MLRSLVGSEMCIRDRAAGVARGSGGRARPPVVRRSRRSPWPPTARRNGRILWQPASVASLLPRALVLRRRASPLRLFLPRRRWGEDRDEARGAGHGPGPLLLTTAASRSGGGALSRRAPWSSRSTPTACSATASARRRRSGARPPAPQLNASASAVKDLGWRPCATRKQWLRSPVSVEKAATPPPPSSPQRPRQSHAATASLRGAWARLRTGARSSSIQLYTRAAAPGAASCLPVPRRRAP